MGKLQTLIENEGFTDEVEFGKEFLSDSVVPGICMNKGCNYTVGVEPDQDRGWCEICGTKTVKSGFMLMGII
jgi:hypothetical protein